MFSFLKKYSLILSFTSIIFFYFSQNLEASDQKITHGSLNGDKVLLKEIASTIFSRQQDISYISDKICTHGPEIYKYWKKNKWQTLDTSQRTKIKQDLTSKFNIDEDQGRRTLQRDHYYLLNTEIISNYLIYGKQAIENGSIILDISKGNGKYGIVVTMEFPGIKVGEKITRAEPKYTRHPTHTLKITFDVDMIVKNMLANNTKNWDEKKDGKISTLCPADE